MNSFCIRFDFPDSSSVLSGFDTAPLELTTGSASFHSLDLLKPSTMMAGVSSADMMFGVAELLRNPSKELYEFVGTGSSFRLLFYRKVSGCISIDGDFGNVGVYTEREFVYSLKNTSRLCFEPLLNRLCSDDPCRDDLEVGIGKIKNLQA